LSPKQLEVLRFDRICQLVYDNKHLELEGFEQIVELAMGMNPSGKRKYSGSEILTSLRPGERIVCATGNRGIACYVARAKSDLVHSTGSNRWSPPGGCRSVAGNTEGKIVFGQSP
jgi:hypothetical protein